LFGNYLLKYFKLLIDRKYASHFPLHLLSRYYLSETDKQIMITQFANVWMKNRAPLLRLYFNPDH
jgi:hypothetical protein